MAAELKPCPFCGGEAEIVREDQFGRLRFFVACLGCGIETPRTARTKEKAVEAWNRRVENNETTNRHSVVCETCVHNRVCRYKADRLLDEEEGVNRCAEHLYITCGSCDRYQECKAALKKPGLDPAGAVACARYDNIRQCGWIKRLFRRIWRG